MFTPTMFSRGRVKAYATRASSPRTATPGPRYKISPYKTFAKGWVAQKHLLIGNYRSGVRFSKGWVRKDKNLITWIGCMPVDNRALTIFSDASECPSVLQRKSSGGRPGVLAVPRLWAWKVAYRVGRRSVLQGRGSTFCKGGCSGNRV